MKTFKFVAVLMAMSLFPLAHAQTTSKELRQAATGARFQVGDTGFRLVPGAIAVKGDATPPPSQQRVMANAAPLMGASVDGAVGHVGPYAIVLPKAGAGVATARADLAMDGTAGGGRQAVAINESSGQPVLVTSRVKVFVSSPALVAQLAKETGGTVVYASDVDGSGVIKYATVDQAMAAQPKIKAAKGVDDAFMDVIQAINKTN
jgi:hypothetical protein